MPIHPALASGGPGLGTALVVIVYFVLGLAAGVLVDGIVASFHYDGGLWPRPRCRSCGAPAPRASAIPLLGVTLDPSCRACNTSWRTRALQVQAVTALAFAALGFQYQTQPALLAVSLIEAALFVAILFIDLELRLIPTFLVIILVALGLGSAALRPEVGLQNALIGGVLGFGSFFALVLVARVFFGEGAFGMGDANLALAIGCITGYPLVTLTLSTGVFLGGLGALFMIAVRRTGMRSTMPYGPYLVLAVLYMLVRGNPLS